MHDNPCDGDHEYEVKLELASRVIGEPGQNVVSVPASKYNSQKCCELLADPVDEVSP